MTKATPTIFFIDHKGAIRRKWVGKAGANSIDAALEQLIQEAEKSAPPK